MVEIKTAVRMDGKEVSQNKRNKIKEECEKLKRKGITPGLAVIIVGDDPASKIYVANKKKACAEVGFYSREYSLPSNTTQEELLFLINELNHDNAIHGILVQSPLPKGLDENVFVNAISPEKDVDCFHPVNVGNIMIGNYSFLPCTPAGIIEILDYYNVEIEGKNCVVIGRSNIVGKPMGLMLLKRNGTVTICHRKTRDLTEITRRADILVVAIGRAGFVKADMVKEGAVVIDVGMNRKENGKLTGDVDYEVVKEKCSYITPVPGGVGPMTITMLLQNTLTAAEKELLDR